jgi:hypothetical protein
MLSTCGTYRALDSLDWSVFLWPAHVLERVPGGETLYWLLGTSVRNMANFAFSSYLFAWHVKLKRVKSKDVLLALPEKQPQTYEKHRRLLGERA